METVNKGQYGFSMVIDDKVSFPWPSTYRFANNKVYTHMNKPVPFELKFENTPTMNQSIFLRTTIVFSKQELAVYNVVRCPNHNNSTEPTNYGKLRKVYLFNITNDLKVH